MTILTITTISPDNTKLAIPTFLKPSDIELVGSDAYQCNKPEHIYLEPKPNQDDLQSLGEWILRHFDRGLTRVGDYRDYGSWPDNYRGHLRFYSNGYVDAYQRDTEPQRKNAGTGVRVIPKKYYHEGWWYTGIRIYSSGDIRFKYDSSHLESSLLIFFNTEELVKSLRSRRKGGSLR